mgnify:CR=1 FL=1
MIKKRGILLLFFGLIFLSMFLGIVSAADPIFDPIKQMFTDWGEGKLSINLAKYLLAVLVGLIIYSVLDFFPPLKGTEKGFLRGSIAAIVAFLGIAYLNPGEIYAILASYSALGFVLSAVFPFVILVFFSVQVHKDGGAGGRVLAKLTWFGFLAFLVYKIIEGFKGGIDGGIPYGMKIAYLIAIGFSILYMLIFEKMLVKLMFKEELAAEKDTLKKQLTEQSLKRKLESGDLRDVGKSA